MNQTKENHEPIKNPWSIKGIKPNNRETAKQIAGENGLTIGEWINNLIEDADNKSDSEKSLLHALDNQPVNQEVNDSPKPKAESIRDIYEQYSTAQTEDRIIAPEDIRVEDTKTEEILTEINQPETIAPTDGFFVPETTFEPKAFSVNDTPSPFSSRAEDMNQPENLGINYDVAPSVQPIQNETSRLALAMEMLNRKLETVAQPVSFAQPAAAPFVQPVAPAYVQPVAAPMAHNNNNYAPIPLVSSDRNVESLARRLEDGEARYERKSERISNTLEDLKEAQNTINEKLRRLESNDNNQRTIHSLQALETSLDSIMRQLSDTNLRTTRIEQELVTEKNNRLTPEDVEKILEKSVNEINSTVATEFVKFNERLSNVEDYNNKSAEHTEKTNASMRDALVELSARLSNLEGDDTERMRQDLEARISSLIGRIGEIEDNIEEVVAKTQAEAQEKYSGIIRELNERIEASEKGTISAIENIGNKLVSTAEVMDQRIREIEEINANAKDSQLAVKMEIGKLSNAIDERLNDLESSSSMVVNKANAHLNTIAEQLNSRLSVFESRSRELEDRIKNQETTLEQRFESAHEDIAELVRKNTDESSRLIDDKLGVFETRISAAQEMAQSITKPLHETLVDLVDRLENMEIGNKANNYSEAVKPANYSYQLSPNNVSQPEVKLEMLDEHDEVAIDEPSVIAPPVAEEVSVPTAHIAAASIPEDAQEAFDPFGSDGFAAPKEDETPLHADDAVEINDDLGIFATDVAGAVPEYHVPEYSVPEYDLPLAEELTPEESSQLEETLKAPANFSIPSENRLFASEEVNRSDFATITEDEEFNFFNEPKIEDTDFINHEDDDINESLYKAVGGQKHDDLTALSEFEGDFDPNAQDIAQSKTFEFDKEIDNEQSDYHQPRKPFGADYLEQARNAAMSAADDKHKNSKVKKKPLAASSKDGSDQTKNKKVKSKDELLDINDKSHGHKPLVSPIGVALAGVLVASGAYAGYNYLQQQQAVKAGTELPAAIKNHEAVTSGQAAVTATAPTAVAPVAVDATQNAQPAVNVDAPPAPVVANTTEKTETVAKTVAATPTTKLNAPNENKTPAAKAAVSKETATKPAAPEAKKVSANNTPVIASAANQPSAKTVYGQAVSLEQAGNFKGAADLYAKAAASGDARAMNKLSKMFERGQGVPKDISKAKALTEKAALIGSRQAQHNLGVYYADGEGGERNYAKAADSFRKAAKRGMTDSQFNLGAMAERGIGVEKNQKEAYYWYSLAAKSGDSDAKTRAANVGSKLAAADKAETDRRINTFRPEQGGYE